MSPGYEQRRASASLRRPLTWVGAGGRSILPKDRRDSHSFGNTAAKVGFVKDVVPAEYGRGPVA